MGLFWSVEIDPKATGKLTFLTAALLLLQMQQVGIQKNVWILEKRWENLLNVQTNIFSLIFLILFALFYNNTTTYLYMLWWLTCKLVKYSEVWRNRPVPQGWGSWTRYTGQPVHQKTLGLKYFGVKTDGLIRRDDTTK